MYNPRMVSLTDRPVLERLLGLDRAPMSPEAATFLMTLGLAEADKRRMNELSAKASAGTLTEVESQEIDLYLLAADFLTTIHSKARVALRDDHTAR